jgi:hypothetical protein
MSVRTLRIYVERLPSESWTKTELRNAISDEDMERARSDHRPDKAPWSSVELLLADVKDAVRQNTSAVIACAGGKPGPFTPTPRPGYPPTSAGRRLSDEQRRAIDPRLRNQQPKEA